MMLCQQRNSIKVFGYFVHLSGPRGKVGLSRAAIVRLSCALMENIFARACSENISARGGCQCFASRRLHRSLFMHKLSSLKVWFTALVAYLFEALIL
jgi:hypothetical protein